MKRVLTFLLLLSTFAGFAKNEDKELADSIKKLIEDRNYVFVAQSALPLRGRFINLSPPYDVKVNKDFVESYLPYFGRAHSAIFPTDEQGIKFKSTDYDYKVKKTKHGWDVTIKPKDVPHGVELFFTISSSGYAMLRVSDARRDAITFNGYIVNKKE